MPQHTCPECANLLPDEVCPYCGNFISRHADKPTGNRRVTREEIKAIHKQRQQQTAESEKIAQNVIQRISTIDKAPIGNDESPKSDPKIICPSCRAISDASQLKHTDRSIISPIDIPLWDRAKWRATLFVMVPHMLPILGIAFENGDAGQAIFRAWQEHWGQKDEDDTLRIAVITGLSKQNPAEYAVTVGPNLRQIRSSEGKRFLFVSRINRMTPTSSINITNFIAAYQRTGGFLLVPAQMDISAPRPFIHLAITKRHLHIRQAWQISENDPDVSVLHEDDEPIIPEGVTDPPVNKALVQLRAFRQANRQRP